MAYFRPSVLTDCLELAPKLRQQDLNEITASHGMSAVNTLSLSFKISNETNTIIHEGEVIGMFGYGSDGDEVAVPWLLASDKLPKISKEFLPQSKRWVDGVAAAYPVLVNRVDVRNTVAIRWLKFLGFKFITRIENYGVGQIAFYEFVRADIKV